MSADAIRYQVMPNPRLSDGVLDLRAVQPADIEAIRQWRNAQMDVLRQTAPISPEQQERYFVEQVWPQTESLEPSQVLVTLERAGVLIGYGGLVHISWPNRRAEVSFLLTPELEKNSDELIALFSRFLDLMKQLAFGDLGLRRLCTETFEHRTRHIATLEASGFRCEGRLREHVLVDGRPMDSFAHGLLACEWKSAQ
ncbi:RimJ/RimL family protein N-acetyltransferase [Pseudomonas migulae]|uniref:GNAT family N-acetyltransferase n=1 Tax=Pseudomonas migulae TaxID=78543 RepID=UPI00209E02E6|nr:GNAT family N-acetyltransferase [Pseudomonas migulae]MCP1500408.1 RimJ/RimL family protein N-acetyltransferase [Pseudomonas migulae]